MRNPIAVGLAVAACLAAAPAQAAQAPSVAAFDNAIRVYEEALDREGVVGGAVLLLGRDGYAELRTRGNRVASPPQPIDADALYHWASITKVFTAIAAMQLVERDLLSLDDPVVRYIPALRDVHDPFGPVEAITIRHLLTHSAGFRGPTWPWNTDGADERVEDQPLEPAEWSQVEAMLPYIAVQFEPGSRFAYSNLGLSLLGRVVETIMDEPIEVTIDKNILKPLGMTRSYFDATPWYLNDRRVHSYLRREGELTAHEAEVITGATVANGGLNGTIGDMGRFARFLMGDPASYPVLRPETLAMMLEPQIEMERDERRTVSIGLAFFISDERDADGQVRRYFGHSGFQRGHRSALYVSRDGCCAFVLGANTATAGGNPSASALRVALVDTVFPLLRRDEREPSQ